MRFRSCSRAGTVLAVVLLAALSNPDAALATATPVDLGVAATYSVLAGSAVANTGPTTLDRDLGLSPGTAITGFPPGVAAGTTHQTDAQAALAQAALTTAYNAAAGQAPDASVSGDLVGLTLSPGVYNSSSSLAVTGALTLDGQGDPNAVFVIQIGSTLTTGSASTINAINGAQACNVYWQVGSSATLGTASSFLGTIMALTSITVTTGTTVRGRALARNGQVTLDSDNFITPTCAPAPTPTPTATVGTTAAPSPTAPTTPTVSTSTVGTRPVSTRPAAPRPTAAPTSSTRPKASTAPDTSAPARGAGFGAGSGSGSTSAVPTLAPVGNTAPAGTGSVLTSDSPHAGPTPGSQLAQTGAAPPLALAIGLIATGGAILLLTGRVDPRAKHRR